MPPIRSGFQSARPIGFERHADIASRRARLAALAAGDLSDPTRRPDRSRGIHVNRGRDDSLLLVVFTGMATAQRNRRFAFEQQTARMECSRVLLHDADSLCYLRGIRPTIDGYPALRDGIVELIDELQPQRVIFAGECLGGYAALRMGCELNVEAVHAFGAVTLMDVPTLIRQRQWRWMRQFRRQLMQLYRHGFHQRANFDLRRVIEREQGATRFFVHAARNNASDTRAATHLAGLPRTAIILHPGDSHIPAFHLEGRRMLDRWLRMTHDTLDLSDTPATDEDVAALLDLRELVDLNLSKTRISDAALPQLAHLPALRQLRLADANLSPAAIDAFRAARPQCRVTL